MQSMRTALAMSAIFLDHGSEHAVAEKVKMLGRSADPATFNAIGAGIICDVNFNGAVTFPEFASLLSPAAFGHPAWRFDAPYLRDCDSMRRCKSPMTAGKTIPYQGFGLWSGTC